MPSSRRTPQWKIFSQGWHPKWFDRSAAIEFTPACGRFSGRRCGGVVNSAAWGLDAVVGSLLRWILGMLLQRGVGGWAFGFAIGWNSERDGVGEVEADEGF